jgi:hypothetical protein
MNIRSLRFILVYVVAALLVALCVHQNMLRRGIASDATRVGVPIAGYSSDLNDSYLYFSLVKRGADACRSPADKEEADASGNPLACTYISAIVIDNLIYKAIRVFASDRAVALGTLLILQTALLAFSALLCLSALLRKTFNLPLAIGLAGGVIFLADAFSWSLLFGHVYENLSYIWRYEANVVRLVSPTIYWTVGLCSLVALLALIEKPNVLRYALAGGLLVLTSSSSIAVGATIGAGVGLAFAIATVRTRRIDYPLLFAGLALLAGLVWQELFFSRFYKTEFGSQLGHGTFTGLKFNWYFLPLMIPILIGRIGAGDGRRQAFLKSVLFGAMWIGILNGSVELGDRLWLRGAAMIAFVLVIAWVLTMLVWLWQVLGQGFLKVIWGMSGWNAKAAQLTASLILVAGFSVLSGHIRPFDPNKWYGVVERDRYEAIEWIAQNTQSGNIVASSNIDDTNLIEFYTDATAFVGLYGLNALPFDELVRRYLYVMDMLQSDDRAFAGLVATRQADLTAFFEYIDGPTQTPYDQDAFQRVGFYELLVYHSYNAAVPNLFAGGTVAASFVERLARLRAEAASRTYQFSYIILRNTDRLKSPQDFREVYRNEKYTIYAPERK